MYISKHVAREGTGKLLLIVINKRAAKRLNVAARCAVTRGETRVTVAVAVTVTPNDTHQNGTVMRIVLLYTYNNNIIAAADNNNSPRPFAEKSAKDHRHARHL